MATLERYNSFDELKNSEVSDKKSSKKTRKKNYPNTIKEFAKLLRENAINKPKAKKRSTK